MSTSRLEKFIYAICSMEVSDLPAPLSRIEILWNCLITGETPDFEPQSRNEQYLMAMLGLYELENLPTPMSRGEKLLYKIAMGETDLSDVPGYLSRYEELLKYLIENGGISGGDFEYVLYTLNQRLSTLYSTKERPVKSAILKGQTSVNLIDFNETNGFDLSTGNIFTYNPIYTLEPNITYTFKIFLSNVSNDGTYDIPITFYGTTKTIVFKEGWNTVTFLPTTSTGTCNIRLYGTDINKGATAIIRKIMLLKGDYTNVDIPYFTGMQSVKLPVLSTVGKNLLNINGLRQENAYIDNSDGQVKKSNGHMAFLDYIRIPSDKNITFFNNTVYSGVYLKISFYDGDKQFISGNSLNTGSLRVVSPSNAKYCRVSGFYRPNDFDLQLEVGDRSSYEPFKSNILTVNEDVTLRGIDDVKDELNCLTGEVTQRIGEIVLDGSENWVKPSSQPTNTSRFLLPDFPNNKNAKILSNIRVKKNAGEDEIGIWCDTNTVLNVDTSVDTVESLKVFLSKNPINLQYSLATESIKTVDLITVDQDGQPTQLKTFNDITYVELSSEGLIPSVDLEVATKINEALSTMGLQHHELSETQNKLGQTIDEQSENTDATMMATTEIYEQIL